jgi:hypothetical protein
MTVVCRNALHWLFVLILVAAPWCCIVVAEESTGCPQEGCRVKIKEIRSDGTELLLTFQANFRPKMPGKHIHVWWGENFTIEQEGLNALSAYGVPKGEWDYTDDYPQHSTHGPSSTAARADAHTLCVSAADLNHNIIDVTKFDCVDAKDYLPKPR